MNDQDGKASIPKALRWLISKVHGNATLLLLDELGRKHDNEINELGYKTASNKMRQRMKDYNMPRLLVRYPIGLGLKLYGALPLSLQNFYHKLIS